MFWPHTREEKHHWHTCEREKIMWQDRAEIGESILRQGIQIQLEWATNR